jgi:rubredoxin
MTETELENGIKRSDMLMGMYKMIKLNDYNNRLDNVLKDIECPKCKMTHESGYWRKILKYPRGKVIENNKNRIICDNCGFEYDVIITFDIDEKPYSYLNSDHEMDYLALYNPPLQRAAIANYPQE